jgi:preprotein translocase subunit SecG
LPIKRAGTGELISLIMKTLLVVIVLLLENSGGGGSGSSSVSSGNNNNNNNNNTVYIKTLRISQLYWSVHVTNRTLT